jgi:hypothetical protein
VSRRLDGQNINDDTVIPFATALTTNKCLRHLVLYWGEFTDRIWDTFTDFLCDDSSVESTYHSNHTLRTIQIHDRYLIQLLPPVDIAHHLSLNGAYYDVGKVGIARHKIIENHFSTSKINTQAFALMSVPVLSQAVEWIGRELLGFSLLYQVLRGVLVPKLSDY